MLWNYAAKHRFTGSCTRDERRRMVYRKIQKNVRVPFIFLHNYREKKRQKFV